jgi:hypothetical protein
MSEDIQYTLKYKIKEDSTDFKVGDLVVGKDKYESYIDSNSVEINKSIFLKGHDEIEKRNNQLNAIDESKNNLDRDISVIIEVPRKSRIFTTNNNYKVVNIYTKQEKKYDSKNIVKLVLQDESTGGKRKTIRRKSKNRKTKKKINGGKTGVARKKIKHEPYEDPNYSNDAEDEKKKKKIFEEMDQLKANREKQQGEEEEEEDTKRILNKSLRYW